MQLDQILALEEGVVMPFYTYQCGTCRVVRDHVASIADREKPQACECGGSMKRRGPEGCVVGSPAHQMGAIFSDGSRSAGHFGKDAKRKRKAKA